MPLPQRDENQYCQNGSSNKHTRPISNAVNLIRYPPSPLLTKNIRLGFALFLKFSLAFFIVFYSSPGFARAFGQTVTLSGKDLPLQKVFREIQEQTGYSVFMERNLLQQTKNVSLDVKNLTVFEVLKLCFKAQSMPLDYVMEGKTITVVKKKGVNFENDAEGSQEIKGIVLGEGGSPLAGATVFVEDIDKQSVTNDQGEFAISNIPSGKHVLRVSYVGYESAETDLITTNFRGNIIIELKVAVNSLDATVIKGYYNTTKRLNTGNVTSVKGEDISKQPLTDPILALEGRSSGLYIQQTSGVPGGYSTIRIRGQNSIANGNDPLFIIDGIPFSSTSLTNTGIGGGIVGSPGNGSGQGMSPFNSFNPSDIESIEILRDADATAIYGSRGANGVILITTKKGKAGATRLDMNVYTGIGKVTRQLDLLNTKQYLEMRHEALKNDNVTSLPSNAYDINGTWDTTRYTDWQKELIGGSSHFTNAQASVSGGNSNVQFLVAGGFSRQTTVFPGDYSDKKINFHSSVNHLSANQRFHLRLTSSFVRNNSNLPSFDFTSNIKLAPDAPSLYDERGNLNWQIANGRATWNNPLGATRIHARAATDNLIGNLNMDYQLVSSLIFKSSFGYSHTEMSQNILTPATSVAPPNDNNPAVRKNNSATTTFNTWIIEPQLNFRHKLSEGILDVLIGTTFQENKQNSQSQTSSGFSSDAMIYNPLSATTTQLLTNNDILYHYNAFFGRLNYSWRERYILNMTARRDGSSRFGPGKQYGNFGAIGVAWVFSNEPLMRKNTSFLSFGKLRGSYGSTGNDQISDYQFLSTYSSLSTVYQGLTGLYPTRISNPYFSWEIVKKLEGGAEFGFWQDRVLFSFSYYRNRTVNQLVGYTLPSLTGFSTIQANLPAVIQNTGEEISINSINIKSKNFKWVTSFNLTIPQNKLISFPGIESSTYKNSYVVGKSLFIRQAYHYLGVDPATGIYSFSTKNSNGVPSSPDDYIWTRPVTQQFYGGLQNSFTYKSLQLDIFIQFVKQLTYNYLYSFNMPGITNQNVPSIVLSRWRSVGDVSSVERFSQKAGPAFTAYRNLVNTSDALISDGSFVRLKNVALSYRLPDFLTRRIHLQEFRVYVQCQNLLTFTNYKGLDPETGGLNMPPMRMITAGAQIGL